MKILPVGAELFHADGRAGEPTWRSKLSLFAMLRTRQKTAAEQEKISNVHCCNVALLLSSILQPATDTLRRSESVLRYTHTQTFVPTTNSKILTFSIRRVTWNICRVYTTFVRQLLVKLLGRGGGGSTLRWWSMWRERERERQHPQGSCAFSWLFASLCGECFISYLCVTRRFVQVRARTAEAPSQRAEYWLRLCAVYRAPDCLLKTTARYLA
jgi:hypothetical protein